MNEERHKSSTGSQEFSEFHRACNLPLLVSKRELILLGGRPWLMSMGGHGWKQLDTGLMTFSSHLRGSGRSGTCNPRSGIAIAAPFRYAKLYVGVIQVDLPWKLGSGEVGSVSARREVWQARMLPTLYLVTESRTSRASDDRYSVNVDVKPVGNEQDQNIMTGVVGALGKRIYRVTDMFVLSYNERLANLSVPLGTSAPDNVLRHFQPLGSVHVHFEDNRCYNSRIN
ncbi:hypothetical protein B0H34DRAFT_804354 [Crassisporium funariophilum]|nr:hypothetical protein B0H34DRAFT_804354 [Crassisporium funariophilum]